MFFAVTVLRIKPGLFDSPILVGGGKKNPYLSPNW